MTSSLRIILLISCCFLFITLSHAQHAVLLLNGKVRFVRAYDIKGEYLIYSKPCDKHGHTRKMYLDRIYSITDSVLGERIVYMPDSADLDELTKIEMRTFIDGEQYAMTHYNKPWNAIGGNAVGVGSGFLGIYGLLIPFGYAAVTGAFNPKVPTTLPDAPANVNDEIFKAGFRFKAKKIKAKDGLLWGGIGFISTALLPKLFNTLIK